MLLKTKDFIVEFDKAVLEEAIVAGEEVQLKDWITRFKTAEDIVGDWKKNYLQVRNVASSRDTVSFGGGLVAAIANKPVKTYQIAFYNYTVGTTPVYTIDAGTETDLARLKFGDYMEKLYLEGKLYLR